MNWTERNTKIRKEKEKTSKEAARACGKVIEVINILFCAGDMKLAEANATSRKIKKILIKYSNIIYPD